MDQTVYALTLTIAVNFNELHQSENQKDISIFSNDHKKLNQPLNFSFDHQSTSNDHFWSIGRGG